MKGAEFEADLLREGYEVREGGMEPDVHRGHPGSPTHEGLTARILAPRTRPEETFVLFEGGIPVATASLARKDLDSVLT